MNVLKMFSLVMAFLLFGLHDANLSTKKNAQDFTVNEISEGIKEYCHGKTNGFCSQKQLYYFKMILKEKADQKRQEIEKKLLEKKMDEEEYHKKQEKIRHKLEKQKMKVWRELNELFLKRNF